MQTNFGLEHHYYNNESFPSRHAVEVRSIYVTLFGSGSSSCILRNAFFKLYFAGPTKGKGRWMAGAQVYIWPCRKWLHQEKQRFTYNMVNTLRSSYISRSSKSQSSSISSHACTRAMIQTSSYTPTTHACRMWSSIV